MLSKNDRLRSWLEPVEVLVPTEMSASLDLHPLVLQALIRRGIHDLSSARQFLHSDAYTPQQPTELPDLDIAVFHLSSAIAGGKQICVWGDFDVDGQTSTTMLVSALRQIGANVSYHIPVRERESHGVNIPVLSKLVDHGIDLLLTCDTGTGANEAIAYANQRGLTVLVTDHHDLAEILPEATALVNPKRLPGTHPLATLPGAGVAYKLVEELFSQSNLKGEETQFLDLVALGIIADVAYQQGEVRFLLQRGLLALRSTSRLGLQTIMENAGVTGENITEDQVAFLLAPRLNAIGRLSDANPVVDFLTTNLPGQARVFALQIEGWNQQRKLLTSQVYQGALAQIQADPTLLQLPVLVLAHPNWPAGVLGIVASRLVERFGKPVVMISTPPDQIARGSARSIEGIHITAAISSQADLLSGYGGHPMAAGLAFAAGEDFPERLVQFRRRLASTIQQMIGERTLEAQLKIDSYLPLAELTPAFVDNMEQLAPFGSGNPPLTLVAPGMHLVNTSPLGKNEEHLLVTVKDAQGESYRLVWWQGADFELPDSSFDLAYQVRSSNFLAKDGIQMEWLDYRLCEAEEIVIRDRKPAHVIDHRHEEYPIQCLRHLLDEETELQVWAEANDYDELQGNNRFELKPGTSLAIWTCPPDTLVLQQVLNLVNPLVIHLFSINPGMDQPQAFLERLAGLVKYAIRAKNGMVEISQLAAATAQREQAVRCGLGWLEAKGVLRIRETQEAWLWVDLGAGVPLDNLQMHTRNLQSALEESAAYRSYFQRMNENNVGKTS
jgi:single-stranded-DNA-specific exonuclease